VRFIQGVPDILEMPANVDQNRDPGVQMQLTAQAAMEHSSLSFSGFV
jgi:hypothetical protein